MSAVLAEKAVEILDRRESERQRTVKLFHRNAAIKHGIPWEDTDQGSATTKMSTQVTTKEPGITELDIIDKVVDKLVNISPPKDGERGRDGKDGKDVDPKAIADMVIRMLPQTVASGGSTTSLDWKDLLKVIALSTIGAGSVAGPVGYFLSPGGDKPPVVNQPADPQPPKEGSLFQYLEDHGYSVGDDL